MDISKLVEFMSTYPQWVRVMFGLWITLSAALLFVLVLFHQGPATKAVSTLNTVDLSTAATSSYEQIPRSQRDGKHAIVDRSSGSGLDSTIAMALDRTRTDLQRETMRNQLNGWLVEASGELVDVRRNGWGEDQKFMVTLKTEGTLLYSSTNLMFADFPSAAESWLRKLQPGERITIVGTLEVGPSFVNIQVVQPAVA